MPTYDYQCDACDHKFELFQGINDPLKKKCPECGKNKLRRLFGTGAAIVFKGSGFYQTDYRSEGYKKSAAADSSSGSSESKPAESKSSESKPAESKPASGSSGKDSAGGTSKKSKPDK
ncbi:MAG: FmdB family zinc ribbon protein [Pirellulales bacterium]